METASGLEHIYRSAFGFYTAGNGYIQSGTDTEVNGIRLCGTKRRNGCNKRCSNSLNGFFSSF